MASSNCTYIACLAWNQDRHFTPLVCHLSTPSCFKSYLDESCCIREGRIEEHGYYVHDCGGEVLLQLLAQSGLWRNIPHLERSKHCMNERIPQSHDFIWRRLLPGATKHAYCDLTMICKWFFVEQTLIWTPIKQHILGFPIKYEKSDL